MNNLPNVVTQLLPRVGFESTTCYRATQNKEGQNPAKKLISLIFAPNRNLLNAVIGNGRNIANQKQ